MNNNTQGNHKIEVYLESTVGKSTKGINFSNRVRTLGNLYTMLRIDGFENGKSLVYFKIELIFTDDNTKDVENALNTLLEEIRGGVKIVFDSNEVVNARGSINLSKHL